MKEEMMKKHGTPRMLGPLVGRQTEGVRGRAGGIDMVIPGSWCRDNADTERFLPQFGHDLPLVDTSSKAL